MKKHDLDTPCLVIDLDILEDNLKKMQAGADAAGKKLRPHAKTHKCSTLAHRPARQKPVRNIGAVEGHHTRVC